MMVRFAVLLAFTLVACSSTSSSKTGGAAKEAMLAVDDSTVSESKKEAPGMGALCMAALVGVSVEAGRQCLPTYNPAGQIQLQKNFAQLEGYLLNSEGWDQARVDEFLRKQGARGEISQTQCRAIEDDSDTLKLVKGFIDADAIDLDAVIVTMTNTKSEPRWGDCL